MITLQWNLSETQVARSDAPLRVPPEGELLVVLVGLLLHAGLTYDDLIGRTLALTSAHVEAVATTIEERVPELTGNLGTGERLRRRLHQLSGCAATRTFIPH